MIGAGGRPGPTRSPYGSTARTKRKIAAAEPAAAAARVRLKRSHGRPAAASSRASASLAATTTSLGSLPTSRPAAGGALTTPARSKSDCAGPRGRLAKTLMHVAGLALNRLPARARALGTLGSVHMTAP